LYKGPLLHINPAGEPKAKGGHKPCAGKTRVLPESFRVQGFGQVASLGLWLPRQFTLCCSTGFLYHNKHRCPAGERGIRKKTGRRYAVKVNADALLWVQQFRIQNSKSDKSRKKFIRSPAGWKNPGPHPRFFPLTGKPGKFYRRPFVLEWLK
jgi:hypothetical protein